MDRGGFVLVDLLVGVCLDAVLRGVIEDDGIEPIAERHTGAARGLARGFTRLGPDPFYTPRDAKFHARIRSWRSRAIDPVEPPLMNKK